MNEFFTTPMPLLKCLNAAALCMHWSEVHSAHPGEAMPEGNQVFCGGLLFRAGGGKCLTLRALGARAASETWRGGPAPF